jgi:hypothetical protein
MTSDLIFITQMASIIGYIGTVFILYRILVKQKDATIELLKNRISMLEQQLSTGRDYDQQRISLLENQLTIAKEQDPDVLLKKYKDRLDLAIDELNKLEADRSTDKNTLSMKELEIAKIKIDLEEMSSEVVYERERSKEIIEAIQKILGRPPQIQISNIIGLIGDTKFSIGRIKDNQDQLTLPSMNHLDHLTDHLDDLTGETAPDTPSDHQSDNTR